MIKQGILNYLKNLKFFFTPLGTLALGLILGLSVFIPGVVSSTTTLVKDIQSILSDTSIDFTGLKNSVLSAVQTLDWNNPLNALEKMLNSDWMMNTLDSCVSALLESTEAYTTQFSKVINTFTQDLVIYFSVLILFLILGLIGGFFLTRWFIRKNIAKRSLWKYFLHTFIDSLLNSTLVVIIVWLLAIWKPSIYISSLVSFLLLGFISLFEAYIIHAWKKVDFRKVVNMKNIFKLFLSDFLIFILAGICVLIAIALTNTIAGVIIGVVLIEIAFIVIGLNAEAYAKSVVESQMKQLEKI